MGKMGPHCFLRDRDGLPVVAQGSLLFLLGFDDCKVTPENRSRREECACADPHDAAPSPPYRQAPHQIIEPRVVHWILLNGVGPRPDHAKPITKRSRLMASFRAHRELRNRPALHSVEK
jgi:hypothetical protein